MPWRLAARRFVPALAVVAACLTACNAVSGVEDLRFAGGGGTGGAGGTGAGGGSRAATGGAGGTSSNAGGASSAGGGGPGGAGAAFSVACGGTLECEGPASFCCLPLGASSGVCARACSDDTGVALFCDETADCPPGDVCCTKLDSAGAFDDHASCGGGCGTGEVQLCQSGGDCRVDHTCTGATQFASQGVKYCKRTGGG